MVLAGAGGVDHTELCQLAKDHFGHLSDNYDGEMDLNTRYCGTDLQIKDNSMPFAHVAIAVEGCGWTNPENIPLMIANTIIGSYDRSMNIMPQSKSFAENVLRYNMVNSYQAFNTCYKDTGKTFMWFNYFKHSSMLKSGGKSSILREAVMFTSKAFFRLRKLLECRYKD